MTRSARPHISWLIAWAGLAVAGGIMLSTLPMLRLHIWWLFIAGTLLFVGIRKSTLVSIACFILAGLMIGMWRGGLEQIGLSQYEKFYDHTVAVQATVSDDVAYGPGGDQRLMLSGVSLNGVRVNGQIWISSDSGQDIKRSDLVVLKGKLGSGFGSAAASMFHASIIKVTHPNPPDFGLQTRDWFAASIRAAIPEPESSLASGYLVGQRSNLPADLDNELKATGLTHAVVASGYNLTILVSLARQLFAQTSKYLAALSATSMVVGFMLMSGLSPSMTRAGLVAGLTLAAWYYGRRLHPFVLLAIAAAATALINPFYVWGDIGWYLSFTSFAGVIILSPLVQHALWHGDKKPGFAVQILVDTMSAQLVTLPVMVFAFGHYATYALIANLLVLPLIPITMLLIFIAGLCGLLAPAFAHTIGLPATLVLHYMTTVIAHIADWPGAYGDLPVGFPILVIGYAALIGLILILWRKTGHDFRAEPELITTS